MFLVLRTRSSTHFKLWETVVERSKESRVGEFARSSNGRERILSKHKDIHYFFERKADHAFPGDCTAQA